MLYGMHGPRTVHGHTLVVYQPPAQAPQAPAPVAVEASAPSANSSVATTPEGHIYLDSPQHLGRRRRTGN